MVCRRFSQRRHASPLPDYQSPASFGSLELKKTTAEFIGQTIEYDEAHLVPIACRTLDSFSCDRVDLVKIDVEGMEIDVLQGATEILRKKRPIIVVESYKTGREAIAAFLNPSGTVSPFVTR